MKIRIRFQTKTKRLICQSVRPRPHKNLFSSENQPSNKPSKLHLKKKQDSQKITKVVVIHARVGMFVFNVLWMFDSLFDAVEAMFDFLVKNRESFQLRQLASNSFDRGMQTWTSVFDTSRVFCYVLKN